MKKIISTILVFAMIVTMVNIPVIVNADTISVVDDDLTKYTSMDDLVNWYKVKDGTTADVSVGNDGLEMKQVTPIPLNSAGTKKNGNFSPEYNKVLKTKTVDEANNTVVTLEKLQGNIDINIDYAAKIVFNDPVGDFTFGNEFYRMVVTASETGIEKTSSQNSVVELRLMKTLVNPVFAKGVNYSEDSGENHSIKLSLDTVNKKASFVLDGDTENERTGDLAANVDYVNAINFSGMERLGAGSYFKIKKIQVNIEPSAAYEETMAVVNSLPESLTDDYSNVVDNISIPEDTEYVKWSTSDETVISADGVVTRGTEDKTVEIIATVDLGNNGGVYTKTYTLNVLKEGTPVEDEEDDEEEESKLIVIEEDFTKYSNISDVPNLVVDKETHATVKAVKGTGIVVSQIKATPLAGDAVNSDSSPEIAHVVEGTFNEDSANRTAYRINRFNGKYRITMEYTAKCESYPDGLYGEVPISTPYYTLILGQVPSVKEMTSTINATGLHFRVFSGKTYAYNSASASSSTLSNKMFSYGDSVAKLSVDVDTISRDASIMFNDNTKTISKGPIVNSGYLNAFSLKGFQRMLPGTEFVIKNIKFEQLEEDEQTNIAIAALDKLPATLVENPYAVTDNVVLPEFEGITWSTSNSNVMDENGVISRWYDDRDVVVTATYATGSTVLYKEYTLTVKKLDSFYSRELLNYSGNEFEGIVTSGDAVIGKTEVSDNGIKVSKVVDANANVIEEQPAYYMDYRMYGEEKPYDASTKSQLFTSGYSGIYDVNFDITPSINGDKPVYVSIGKNTAKFEQIAALRLVKDEIGIVYNGITNRVMDETVSGKTYNIRFRIDTDAKKVWMFVNDKLVTKDLGFYDIDIIDTLRVVLDNNNNNGDNVVINNVVFKELEKVDIEDKNLLVTALDKIKVTDITNDPDNAVTIKQLPETVNGYSIEWSSNSNQVDVDKCLVYRGESDSDVIVTALVNMGSVYAKKLFYITVPKTDNVIEMIENYISDLDETITKQNPDDIRYDINLPSQYNGLNIEWEESSAPGILNTDGKINKSVAIVDAVDVALKAKITLGSETVYKTYNYKVSPRAYERVVYSGTNAPERITVNGVENIVITRDSITDIKFTQNGNGVIKLADSCGKTIATVNVNNDKFNVAYSNTVSADYPIPEGTTVDLKLMVMPDIDRVTVWMGDKIIVDFGETFEEIDDLTSITVSNDSVLVSETKITTDEYGVLDINIANVDYFAPFAKNAVKEDVSFVSNTVIDANVEWTSSDASMVNPVNGKVNLPDSYEFVDVTLTLTSNSDENVKRILNKKIAVACSVDKNLALNKSVTSSVMEEPGYVKKYITDGNLNTSYGTAYVSKNPVITIDLGKKTYFNTLYINEDFSKYDAGLKSYTLAYSDDAENWTVIKTGTISGVESSLVEFDTVNARYISFTVNECETDEFYLNELEVYLFVTPYELIKIDVDAIDLKLGYSVTNDIVLPVKGLFGTEFKWSSSHPEIITADGKVTRPESNTTVTLTVTAEHNGEKYSREFSAYVPSKTTTGAKPVGGGSGGGGGGSAGGMGTGTSTVPGLVETDVNVNTDVEEVKPEGIFADMDTNHWAYENVAKLKELGIIDGDEKGNFNPSGNVTREQFLKMLVETVKLPTEFGNTQFSDVDSSAWYAPYVAAGVNAGLVNGISEDAFGVGTNIARQDMAVMILRVMNSKNINVNVSDNKFADDADISDYAKVAVYVVRSSGIIEGYENNFNPKASLTRAEAATVIIKLLDVLQGDGE